MADISEKIADLSKQAVKLRDKDGLPWHEVAGELGVSTGKALLAYEFGKVKPADRVDPTPKNVVRLRDKEGLSWGRISARTGHGEASLRALYEEGSGTSAVGNRIGKGGRYPGQGGKSPRKAGAAKKAPAKKSVAKKATAVKKTTGVAKKAGGAKKAVAKKAGGVKKSARKAAAPAAGGTTNTGGRNKAKTLVDMDFDELSERLEGRKIGVAISGTDRTKTHEVKSVKSLDGDQMTFLDPDLKTHTVRVADIKRASK